MPTVVIVDDHQSFRRFARRLLEEAGLTVVGEAADGASALTEVRALNPDVVLLDVVLPDTSGLAVAEQLALEPHRHLIVVTSSRSRSDFGAALDSPAIDAFIAKHELTGAAIAAVTGAR